MAIYQVRYWFESSMRDKTGEQVSEIVEADTPHAVGKRIEEFMAKDTFVIVPSFGHATGGVVVVNARLVRYVEVVPSQTPGATPTAFASPEGVDLR